MTEWILPANPKLFRVDDAFRELIYLEWNQSRLKSIKRDDICYIYLSSPIQEIHWKCVVTDVNRMITTIDDSSYNIPPTLPESYIGPVIELKRLYEYDTPEMLSYRKLQQHGLKTRVMGPSRLNAELSKYLSEVDKIQTETESRAEYFNSLSMGELKKLAEKHSGQVKRRKIPESTTCVRNAHIAEFAKRQANGKCQLCGLPAPFSDKKGRPYLESHHVEWLSQGGDDSISNTVALCPNCHKKMHIVADVGDVVALKVAAKNNAL